MRTVPTVENAATWFNAKTVTHHLDVADRQTALIVDARTPGGSTVRFYNADGDEFMTLTSDNVSTRFDSLFGGRLVGVRHSEEGRLYAILQSGDRTREEAVDLFPFAEVQVGSDYEFGRRITAVVVEYRPADVVVNLVVPFGNPVTAFRAYSESEADWLL